MRLAGADIAMTYLNEKARPHVQPLAEFGRAEIFMPLEGRAKPRHWICPPELRRRYRGIFVIDAAGNTVTPPRGASDAFLMPYHVERGKIMNLSENGSRRYRSSMRNALPRRLSSRVFPCRTTKTMLLRTRKQAWSGPAI